MMADLYQTEAGANVADVRLVGACAGQDFFVSPHNNDAFPLGKDAVQTPRAKKDLMSTSGAGGYTVPDTVCRRPEAAMDSGNLVLWLARNARRTMMTKRVFGARRKLLFGVASNMAKPVS